MQKIVIEEPYQFIPPYRGRVWGELFRPILPLYLRASHNIVEVEPRGLERLEASVRDGYGVLIAPNHCRLSDPMTMGWIVRAAGIHTYSMASWHLFKQDRLFDRASAFMMRRLGAFSILREGTDRTSLTTAIDILASAERPLVIFPEGVVSRSNDRLGPLMDGIAFIARMGARKAAKRNKKGVLIHPVALRYEFLDDVEEATRGILDEIERRLTWEPNQNRPLAERITRICDALLTLKEVRHFGAAQQGTIRKRRNSLIDALLGPLEAEWVANGSHEENTISRVKEIRVAILAKLLDPAVNEQEKTRLRRQMDDAYLAQQLHFYSADYARADAPPEHLLETVERIEEDLTDTTRNYGRFRVTLDIGEPILVSPEREKRRDRDEPDPLMAELSSRLVAMLEESGREVAAGRNGGAAPTTILYDTGRASGL